MLHYLDRPWTSTSKYVYNIPANKVQRQPKNIEEQVVVKNIDSQESGWSNSI
jgi:hypothetical protein